MTRADAACAYARPPTRPSHRAAARDRREYRRPCTPRESRDSPSRDARRSRFRKRPRRGRAPAPPGRQWQRRSPSDGAGWAPGRPGPGRSAPCAPPPARASSTRRGSAAACRTATPGRTPAPRPAQRAQGNPSWLGTRMRSSSSTLSVTPSHLLSRCLLSPRWWNVTGLLASSDRDVACAERHSEVAVRRAGADQRRARRVDFVRARERERESRQRRPAPAASADRRRADTARLRRGRRPRPHAGDGCPSSASGAPSGLQSNTRCGASRSPCSSACSQPGRSSARRGDEHARSRRAPAGARERTRSSQHRRSPRRSTAARARGTRASARSARARRVRRRASSRSSSGVGSAPNWASMPLDEVDLGLRQRRVEPHAAHRRARGGSRPRSRSCARLASGTCCRGRSGGTPDESSSSSASGERPERAAALVAVEANVASRDVVLAPRGSCRRPGCP